MASDVAHVVDSILVVLAGRGPVGQSSATDGRHAGVDAVVHSGATGHDIIGLVVGRVRIVGNANGGAYVGGACIG